MRDSGKGIFRKPTTRMRGRKVGESNKTIHVRSFATWRLIKEQCVENTATVVHTKSRQPVMATGDLSTMLSHEHQTLVA